MVIPTVNGKKVNKNGLCEIKAKECVGDRLFTIERRSVPHKSKFRRYQITAAILQIRSQTTTHSSKLYGGVTISFVATKQSTSAATPDNVNRPEKSTAHHKTRQVNIATASHVPISN